MWLILGTTPGTGSPAFASLRKYFCTRLATLGMGRGWGQREGWGQRGGMRTEGKAEARGGCSVGENVRVREMTCKYTHLLSLHFYTLRYLYFYTGIPGVKLLW